VTKTTQSFVIANKGAGLSAARWGAPAILLTGDVIVLAFSLTGAGWIRYLLSGWLPIAMDENLFVGVGLSMLLMPIAYSLAGLYPGYGQTGVERLQIRVTTTSLCFIAMIAFDYVAQKGQWSRGLLLAAAALSMVLVPIWDGIARHILMRLHLWGEAVVVLGADQRRNAVRRALIDHPEIGWIPIDLQPAERSKINIAIVALSSGEQWSASVADEMPYQRIVFVPDFGSMQTLWVKARDLGIGIGLEMRRNLLIKSNQAVKRLADLVLGCVALFLLAPVIAIFAALIMTLSPGAPFYVQSRLGRYGEVFGMIKLRTMRPNADQLLADVLAGSESLRSEWARTMKIQNDPRIIPVLGEFLRRFSIDELPQLWNVLKGEMSLVGPRPLPDYHASALPPDVDRLRHQVRPGITGLWQVSGRSQLSVEEQGRLDSYYVRNWSIWLDLHIVARTFIVVLKGTGS
jgi:exopolysaccharide biosynthesis polyprenyl glycosylphosphotransferase